MPVSKAQIKVIQSLHQKKHRQMYGKFLVEGYKAVKELLASSFKIDAIYALPEWIAENGNHNGLAELVNDTELGQLATQQQPHGVIAVAYMPEPSPSFALEQKLYIACDCLNDPGNAGTIIRIADWFGLGGVLFSLDSVEVYNPKVVSAAKGSLFRVPVHYTDLATLFKEQPQLPIYGTAVDGESIYDINLPSSAIILIGNEANGIGAELQDLITQRICIPSHGRAESLNAAVATGIIVSEWRRKA